MNVRLRTALIASAAFAFLLHGSARTASAQESLTVTLLPGAVSFSLANGRSSNPGSLPLSATTSWTLGIGRTAVTLAAYFTSATSALAHSALGNTVDIPSSLVEARVNGGAATPFTQTVTFGAPGAGLQLFSQPITAVNRIGARTDVVVLNINMASLAVPADTYAGTLRFRAQATP